MTETTQSKNPKTNRIVTDYHTKDVFKYYAKKYKKTHVTRKQFGEIIREFNKFIIDDLIRGGTFNAPVGLGTFSVTRRTKTPYFDKETGGLRTNHLGIDWHTTKKNWEENPKLKEAKSLVYYKNHHTDGSSYRFKWNKETITFSTNGYFWKTTRTASRGLAKYLLSPDATFNYQEYVHR